MCNFFSFLFRSAILGGYENTFRNVVPPEFHRKMWRIARNARKKLGDVSALKHFFTSECQFENRGFQVEVSASNCCLCLFVLFDLLISLCLWNNLSSFPRLIHDFCLLIWKKYSSLRILFSFYELLDSYGMKMRNVFHWSDFAYMFFFLYIDWYWRGVWGHSKCCESKLEKGIFRVLTHWFRSHILLNDLVLFFHIDEWCFFCVAFYLVFFQYLFVPLCSNSNHVYFE